MVKTIQYANKHWVKFKNYVCLREKEAYLKINEMSSVLVHVLWSTGWAIFMQLIIFETPASIFVAWCLRKYWWKN